MKRMLWAGLAVAMVAGCQEQGRQGAPEEQAQAGQQEEAGQQQQPGMQAQQEEQQAQQGQEQLAMGTVTEMQGDSITVQTDDGQQLELHLDENAEITHNGQPMQRERLQQGSSVRASYAEQGQERTVRRLEVSDLRGGQAPAPGEQMQQGGQELEQQGQEQLQR